MSEYKDAVAYTDDSGELTISAAYWAELAERAILALEKYGNQAFDHSAESNADDSTLEELRQDVKWWTRNAQYWRREALTHSDYTDGLREQLRQAEVEAPRKNVNQATA